MHPPGLFQILVIALIVLVLFGRGRISGFMGDFGKGVKSFRKAISDDDETVRLQGMGPEVVPAAQAATETPPPPDQTSK